MRALLSVTLLLALWVASPNSGAAQEPPPVVQCTALITPATVLAGQAAVQINAALSTSIGAITDFEGPQDSELRLADVDDIPRVDMANPNEVPRPIVMTPETNRVALWINTAEVQPGEFEVQLRSAEGTCTAQLTVEP